MTTQRNDEIDLLELAIKFIKFIKRRIWIFIILFLIGAAIGYVRSIISKPFYETSLTAVSSVDNQLTIDLINSLQINIEDQNKQFVADQLNLPIEIINNLKNIEASEVKNEIVESNLKRIEVKIQYINNLDITKLSKSIKDYIENNPYIKKQIDIQKMQYIELTSKIDKEINELDSLQSIQLNNQTINKKETIIISGESDSYQKIVTLFEKKHSIERAITRIGFIIVEDFVSKNIPKKNTKVNILIYGLFFSFMGVIILIMKKINEKYLT